MGDRCSAAVIVVVVPLVAVQRSTGGIPTAVVVVVESATVGATSPAVNRCTSVVSMMRCPLAVSRMTGGRMGVCRTALTPVSKQVLLVVVEILCIVLRAVFVVTLLIMVAFDGVVFKQE